MENFGLCELVFNLIKFCTRSTSVFLVLMCSYLFYNHKVLTPGIFCYIGTKIQSYFPSRVSNPFFIYLVSFPLPPYPFLCPPPPPSWICAISIVTLQMMRGLECGHLYCTSCWTEYLTTKIMDEGASQMIECPGDCR
jgi:hypothetical protein